MVLKLKTITIKNIACPIYNIYDFPYNRWDGHETVTKGRTEYLKIIGTFDIETTTIQKEDCSYFGKDFGFMYVWQFCLDGVVCMGRTWKEYQIFIQKLEKQLGLGYKKLLVFVHNLQFEFQFMRNFFDVGKIFCRGIRDIVYAEIGGIEYRCSYILSNMGLDKFTTKTPNVTFTKEDGEEFNYHIKRYPDTELTDKEISYCVCDVLGLWQAIEQKLTEDTIATLPITSTGYVRRDFRESCLSNSKYKNKMKQIRLDELTYKLCQEASRGAIAGSNHIRTNVLLEDIDSEDIKSSYPYQMSTKYFPQSKFLQYTTIFGSDKFYSLLNNYCCIIEWECENLKLKQWSAIPYISKAKCRAIEGAKCGNGKVYMAKRIGMCCTEIDIQIIMKQYVFDRPKLHRIHCADRGMLDYNFRKTLLDMFQIKTDLEDGDKYLYDKYKNKINASFGMMLTDILHPEIMFKNNSEIPWKEHEIADITSELNRYYNNKNSFLSYQHGVWVLAHGRNQLVEGMEAVGSDLVQVDTDSVKHEENHREAFNKINARIIAEAESFDVKPYAIKNGKKHYLGVWEHECKDGYEDKPTYKYFKSLGAKKYCYQKYGSDKMEITVAGLSKKSSEYLQKEGGFDAFKVGKIVPPGISGRTSALYNDLVRPITLFIDGHEVTLGSNIAINDTKYQFGMTDEWLFMILDKVTELDYVLEEE